MKDATEDWLLRPRVGWPALRGGIARVGEGRRRRALRGEGGEKERSGARGGLRRRRRRRRRGGLEGGEGAERGHECPSRRLTADCRVGVRVPMIRGGE